MSALFNQTNIAPGTSFAASGGGGGSNYPANALFSSIGVAGSSGLRTLLTSTIAVANSAVIPFTSNTSNTTALTFYAPFSYTNLVDVESKGGACAGTFTFDADNTGAVTTCRVGADNISAFIGSEWPGFITMPFRIYGASIELESDNETFLFCDGKAGALGTISTGTPFASSSNAFSSIISPGGQNANLTALFSTLADVYPACFT